MALPPFEVGDVKLTVAWALPAVAFTFVGDATCAELKLAVTVQGVVISLVV
jgi:hypothetical protein